MEVDFWDVAYRDNAPVLLGVLRRYVKDASVAQDLLHEVFITAIDKYDSYSGKGNFEAWLYRIAVNTALMHLRNERIQLVPIDTLYSMTDDDDTDAEQSDNARNVIETAGFTGDELVAAIDRLPEHHRLVFNMYVMEDFSHKQISAELNISQGTSKSHLSRARKKIQQFLYDDAMNRKKVKEKRRLIASLFFPLFPAKAHYIDNLYREGLSNYKITPTGGISAALEQAVSASVQSVATVATQTATFWGGKLSYIAVCCGTAAITGTTVWFATGINSPLNREHKMEDNAVIINVIDSMMYVPEIDNTIIDEVVIIPSENVVDELEESFFSTETKSETTTNIITNPTAEPDSIMEKPTEPVVIIRQIIERQTVVVRDTIYIEE